MIFYFLPLVISVDRLIRPGVGIGAVRVGETYEGNRHRFSKGIIGDATTGAGQSVDSSRPSIDLDESANDGPIVVLGTASAQFHLANGLHPGSSARRMRFAFPAARPAGAYDDARSGRHVRCDDVRRGIDWWTAGGQVVAIEVHRREAPVDRKAVYVGTIWP